MWTRKDSAQILAAAVLFLVIGLLLFPPVGRPATTPDPAAARIAAAFLKVELAAEHRHPAGPHTISLTCHPATVAGTFRCRDIGTDHGVRTCVSFLTRWNPTVAGVVQIAAASLAYCPNTGGPPA